jgi:hypothetical protein
MDRTVLWSRWENNCIELLHIWDGRTSVQASSMIIGLIEGAPLRVSYRITCNLRWQVRDVHILKLLDSGENLQSLNLMCDTDGRWHTPSGDALPFLDGCTDVDLLVTPFTNTLPIRRLKLQPGESAEIKVAYVDFPTLKINPARQRYTNLGMIDGVQCYKYENADMSFEAVLPVDKDGFVLDYPGLFRRIKYP